MDFTIPANLGLKECIKWPESSTLADHYDYKLYFLSSSCFKLSFKGKYLIMLFTCPDNSYIIFINL